MGTAVYPGSFDPFTNGHKDILERALRIFDQVIIAVVRNPGKNPLFTLQERVEIIKNSIPQTDRVQVDSFSGLLVDYMERVNSHIMVKGLRAVSDFEFEFQMALINRKLSPQVETVFLMTSSEYAFLSSSKVREIASLGGNVGCLVSPFTLQMLKEKFLHTNESNGETIELE